MAISSADKPRSSKDASPSGTTPNSRATQRRDRRHTRRGCRIDKPNQRTNIDAIIALAMAVEAPNTSPNP